MPVRRVLRAVLLPVMVTVAIPAALLLATGLARPAWTRPWPWAVALCALGLALVGAGVSLLAWTIALFARLGRGTLAPWDPTRHLVVAGPYRHVRNPMIAGVWGILLGEAILLGSIALLGWFLVFVTANVLYMPLVGEPGLERRFGAAYRLYRAEVPRWLPRLRPWEPPHGDGRPS